MTSALLALTEETAKKGGLLTDLGINIPVLLTQVVIFSITFVALSRILFSTVLRRMQEREEELRKSREAVERDRAETARLLKDYEARLLKADREAYERAQAALTAGLAQAQAVVAKASAQASEEVATSAAAFVQARIDARPKIRAEVSRLALEMAGKALGGAPGAASTAAVERWLSGRVG